MGLYIKSQIVTMQLVAMPVQLVECCKITCQIGNPPVCLTLSNFD